MSNDSVPYGEGLMVFIETTPRGFVGNESERKFGHWKWENEVDRVL
jgi:hypothetical protein